MRRIALTSYLMAPALLLLAACGFQLRGDPAVGIKSLSVTQDGASQVAAEIRRTLSVGPTRLIGTPKDAEAHLRILREAREKTIYTLTGAGRVYEFQLRLVVRYQVTVPRIEDPVIPPIEIEARRLITYAEAAPIAKEAEEELLYKDMQVDLARQILRHVSAVKREL